MEKFSQPREDKGDLNSSCRIWSRNKAEGDKIKENTVDGRPGSDKMSALSPYHVTNAILR